MKALSIKQPWAWLICAGFKDVENRTWKIGRSAQHGPYKSQTAEFSISLPCRIYVHAGKVSDYYGATAVDGIFDLLPRDTRHTIWKRESLLALPHGAIIGEVDIVDCVTNSPSPWAVKGQYHFVLANPTAYNVPVPCRGRLGVFEPEIDMLAELRKSV